MYESLGESNSWLVEPGVYPPLIGSFSANTGDTLSFDIPTVIPETAKQFSAVVAIYSGINNGETDVALWLWTECNGKKYAHFKRVRVYTSNAIAYDSETLTFIHCKANRTLYIKADPAVRHAVVNIYATGYSMS